MRKKKKEIRVGNYTVRRTPNGHFRIGAINNPKLKVYVSSLQETRKQYDEEMQQHNRISSTSLKHLYYLPLILGESPSRKRGES